MKDIQTKKAGLGKKIYRKFVVLTVVFLILGILMTTVGGSFSTVLTVALEGSSTDWELAKETYTAGIDMNVELEEEGIVLLKNEANTLPMAIGNINVFGDKAVNMVFNASGSATGNLENAVSLKNSLEGAGFTLNEELWNLMKNNEVDMDTAVHEGNSVNIEDFPINEMALDQYSGNCSFENLKAFSDQALVVIGRIGGEGQDLPRSGFGEEGRDSYLELTKEEKDLLKELHQQGFEITVLINSSYAMELGFIDLEEYGVSAALWIGGPGQAGATAVAEVLTGKVTPSGRLADTYAYDLTTQSSYYTSDYYYYLDAADSTKQLAGFSNYSEGIYVGYRWYETADEEGNWDSVSNEYGSGYEGVVQYPFGYGLSYAKFEQELKSVQEENGVITLQVQVTNTSDTYSGKDVMQIYCETPYTNGGVEKSKVALSCFGKTEKLAPGESGLYTLTVDMEDLASYDEGADNGNGCYTLEAGFYEFYLSENAHSWATIDKADNTKYYKYTLADTIEYCGDNSRISDNVAAQNQFAAADGGIKKLSRKDGFANAKETVFSQIDDITISAGEERYELIETKSKDADEYAGEIGNIETSKKLKYTMTDMTGASYDDERWDEFLSQMSVDDMVTLIGSGGWSTAEIQSIRKGRTTDIDGPFGLSNYIQNELGNNESVCVSYCTEGVVASTWNTDLVKRYGETVGAEGNATGVSGWYAPGANLHRSSFGGRNPEYYSEDSYLSGVMCANMVEGAISKGVYVYVKHFAFNDQEANRTNKEHCFMTEQTAREMYLKPFEMAIKEGGATGLMASYMWFEGEWIGGNQNLMTNVVIDEWNFKGAIITDNYCASWMNASKAIMAGTDLILSNKVREVDTSVASTPEGISAMKQACKHILYMIANTAQYRTVQAKVGFDWWKLIYISAQIIFYGCAVLFAVFAVRGIKKFKKENSTFTIETSGYSDSQ